MTRCKLTDIGQFGHLQKAPSLVTGWIRMACLADLFVLGKLGKDSEGFVVEGPLDEDGAEISPQSGELHHILP